jgi:hypothetical protein
MDSIPEEDLHPRSPAVSGDLPSASFAERRYIALQIEFLDYKSRVESELHATAIEQAALHSRLVEQAVELAEAKALIDDMQQQLAFHQRINSLTRERVSARSENGGFWDFLFGGSSSSSPEASPSFMAGGVPRGAGVDEGTIREYERRFAEWQRTAIARIAKEEKKLKIKISPLVNDHGSEDADEGHEEFDEVFDVDWNSNSALPKASPGKQSVNMSGEESSDSSETGNN